MEKINENLLIAMARKPPASSDRKRRVSFLIQSKPDVDVKNKGNVNMSIDEKQEIFNKINKQEETKELYEIDTQKDQNGSNPDIINENEKTNLAAKENIQQIENKFKEMEKKLRENSGSSFDLGRILIETGINNRVKHTRNRLTLSHIQGEIIEQSSDFYSPAYQKIVFGRKSEMLEELSFYTIRLEDEIEEIVTDINDNPSGDLQNYLNSREFHRNLLKIKHTLGFQAELELRGLVFEKVKEIKSELEIKRDELPTEINSLKNKYKNVLEKVNKLKEENKKKREQLILLRNNDLKKNKKDFHYFNKMKPGISETFEKIKKIQSNFQEINNLEENLDIKEYLDLVNKYLESPFLDFDSLIYEEQLRIKRKEEKNILQIEESKNLEKTLNLFLNKNSALKKQIKETKEVEKVFEKNSWTSFITFKQRLELIEGFMKLEVLKGDADKIITRFNFFQILHYSDNRIEVSLFNEQELNEIELIVCKYLLNRIGVSPTFESIWYLIKAYSLSSELNYLKNKGYEVNISEENNNLKIYIKDNVFYLKDCDLFLNENILFFFGGIYAEINE